MKITYVLSMLKFPIVEGTVSQAWNLAKAMKNEGFEVEIRVFDEIFKKECKDGVTIIRGPWKKILRLNTDVLHFFNAGRKHTIKMFFYSLLLSKSKKRILTVISGGESSVWKNGIITKFIKIFFRIDQLISFSYFKNKEFKKFDPLKPNFRKVSSKSKNPTLLYMHFLKVYKGFFDVVEAFRLAKKQIPKLSLIVCTPDKRIKEFSRKYKDVKFKGVIDPEKELSKAWIYLYPIQTSLRTLAVPVSLIEAVQTKTPFISTKVGLIPQYFNDFFLVQPRNPKKLAEKIIHFIKNHSKINPDNALKKKWTNKQVIDAYKKTYLFNN